MEIVAYFIKQRWPSLFSLIERLARRMVRLRYGRRIEAAQEVSRLSGSVNGHEAEMRALTVQDTTILHQFLASLPAQWLEHFSPHPFDCRGLQTVLSSTAFLKYGLFVNGEMRGYALLKVAPTGSAFIGLLVHPTMSGLGLGKFIVAYLYWQASIAGLRARSTISKNNLASVRSHQAVAEYRVVSDLPNDYIMIEFPVVPREKPELKLP